MISIIIPVYNVENYLPQCLDSMLAQTYPDFEVILVDDGSPDKSGVICDEYSKKDARIRVIHQQNAGVSAARNRGISEAKGEWISFVDSDDFVESDYLANFELDKDDADLIVQGLEYYNHKTGEYFGAKKLNKISLTADNLKDETASNELLSVGFPVGKAYRSKLLKDRELHFDTKLSFHEDHIFVLEAYMAAQTIRLSSSISYKYRCYHSDSTLSSKRHPWQMLNDAANGMLKCLDTMSNRFLESKSDYRNKIYSFAYSPKIDAVYELYKLENDFETRHNCYKQIIDFLSLSKYYRPESLKNQIIKRLFSYAPYIIIDVVVRLIVKFQRR